VYTMQSPNGIQPYVCFELFIFIISIRVYVIATCELSFLVFGRKTANDTQIHNMILGDENAHRSYACDFIFLGFIGFR